LGSRQTISRVLKPTERLSYPDLFLNLATIVVQASIGTKIEIAAEGHQALAAKSEATFTLMALHTILPAPHSKYLTAHRGLMNFLVKASP
jgi:hypothetical protein